MNTNDSLLTDGRRGRRSPANSGGRLLLFNPKNKGRWMLSMAGAVGLCLLLAVAPPRARADSTVPNIPGVWIGPVAASTYQFTDRYETQSGGTLAGTAIGYPIIGPIDGFGFYGMVIAKIDQTPEQSAGAGLLYRDAKIEWLRVTGLIGVKYNYYIKDPRAYFVGLGITTDIDISSWFGGEQ